jgi:hypothetical protein
VGGVVEAVAMAYVNIVVRHLVFNEDPNLYYIDKRCRHTAGVALSTLRLKSQVSNAAQCTPILVGNAAARRQPDGDQSS